jgi:hypothetical protein
VAGEEAPGSVAGIVGAAVVTGPARLQAITTSKTSKPTTFDHEQVFVNMGPPNPDKPEPNKSFSPQRHKVHEDSLCGHKKNLCDLRVFVVNFLAQKARISLIRYLRLSFE